MQTKELSLLPIIRIMAKYLTNICSEWERFVRLEGLETSVIVEGGKDSQSDVDEHSLH